MSHHGDLLVQARQLAEVDPKRPKQVNLRRAVSAAYYALFHQLSYDATRQIVGTGSERRPVRLTLRRAFAHTTAVEVAKEFAQKRAPKKMVPALDGVVVLQELADVCAAFVELYGARHDADYDLSRDFTRSEALDLIELVEEAFKTWEGVRKTPAARVCLLSMLVLRSMRG